MPDSAEIQNAKTILEEIKEDPNIVWYDDWIYALEHLTAEDRASFVAKLNEFAAADRKYAEAYNGWGIALASQGKHAEAAEQFAKAAQLDPKLTIDQSTWAVSLAKQGKHLEAAPHFEEALKIDPEDANTHFNYADTLLELKRNDEAIAHYREAIKLAPYLSDEYQNRASALERQERFKEADQIYETAAQLNPLSPDIYNTWGVALEQRQANQKEKNYEPAIEKYKRAVARDEGYIYARYNWGRLLVEQGKYPEAIEKFRRVVEADPGNTSALLSLANALQKQERFDEADAIYQKATEADPKVPDPYNDWGLALEERQEKQKEKNYEAAIEKFKTAIARDEKFVYAPYNWGRLLLEQGKYPEAIERFEQATKADPTYTSALLSWASALQKQEKFDEADAVFRKATEVNQKSAEPFNKWGLALEERQEKQKEKNYEAAIEKFKAAIARDDTYVYPYNNWGNILLELGEFDEAIEKFKLAIKADTTFTQAIVNWGTALSELRRYEEANTQFEKALQIEPKSTSALNEYANALLDQKRYGEAIEHYRRAVEIEPNKPTWYFNWGLTLKSWHKYDEAIRQFQTAIEKQDSYIGAYLECGNALQAKKLFAEAIPWYQKAAELEPENENCLLAWAAALLNLHQVSEARKKFEEAVSKSRKTRPNAAALYHSWGITLCDLDYVEEGIRQYAKAIEEDPEYAYAHHNLAYYREKQGRYKESWAHWQSARRAYKNGLAKARKKHNGDFFYYFGGVLSKLGRDEAEEVYLEGLEKYPKHADILFGLVELYVEQKEELVLTENKPNREQRARAQADARHYFRIAEELLLEEEKRNGPIVAPYLDLAQLYLAMECYDKAKEYVQKALEQEGATAEEHNLMGVVQSRKEDYKGAIDSFRESLSMDSQDLTVRNNLAEAYLNAGLPDKAEEEYQKILNITENHIEAQIGMGQVYLTIAEGKKEGSTDSTDPDFFDDAVHHFARAVELGNNEPCSASSRMKPKKWAALYYSIGYTRVKMYSASRGVKDESLLRRALGDFKLCLKNDPEHYKARRAKKKIGEKLRPLSPERLMEKLGPAAIFLSSAFVFVYTQVSLLHRGKIDEPVLYSSLTFGSLVLMIAGLYLPRLLKLKVAGIELEKSTVDQITTSSTFEISK
jgi:tetratricopeptide (TPR) repeat protein